MRSKGLLQDFANDQLDKPQQRARTYSDASQRAEDEDYELIRGLLSCLSVCLSVCLPACLPVYLFDYIYVSQEGLCHCAGEILQHATFTTLLVANHSEHSEQTKTCD